MPDLNSLSTVRDVQLVADSWCGELAYRDVVIREAINVSQHALEMMLVDDVDQDVRVERWVAEHRLQLVTAAAR